MGSLPRRPDPRHTARPVQDRSTYPGSAATHEGRGGTLPPHGPPATASSGTRVRRLSPGTSRAGDRGPPAPRPGGPDLDAGALAHDIATPLKEGAKKAEGLEQVEQPRAWERADSCRGGSSGRRGEPPQEPAGVAKPPYLQERSDRQRPRRGCGGERDARRERPTRTRALRFS